MRRSTLATGYHRATRTDWIVYRVAPFRLGYRACRGINITMRRLTLGLVELEWVR